MAEILSLVARLDEEMKDRTGSVTLHFKGGVVQKIEYRFFEKIENQTAN